MKTYLITGGAGFIGSNFIKYLFNKYDNIKIINYDKLTYAGNLKNLDEIKENNNYSFLKGDICDKEKIYEIFNTNNIDYVINFAAESHVDRSISDPEIFAKTNFLGTVNLLNISKKFKVKKYIQISTDEVYGTLGENGYFTEDTPISPSSPYSASKASADLMVKAYFKTYNMPINITRCSNNYGPNQFPEKLIPLIIKNSINKNKIPLYGDGLNVRDWVYVEDHCSAIDMVINRGKIGEVYNIGGESEKTNIYIIKYMINYLKKAIPICADLSENIIEYVEDRLGHDRRYGMDISKIKSELNWKPSVVFEEGIKATVDWYLKNRWIF